MQAVCFRADYDRERQLKTAEIIGDERERKEGNKRLRLNKTGYMQVDYGKEYPGKAGRKAGRTRNRAQKYRELAYGRAAQLGLEYRIMGK